MTHAHTHTEHTHTQSTQSTHRVHTHTEHTHTEHTHSRARARSRAKYGNENNEIEVIYFAAYRVITVQPASSVSTLQLLVQCNRQKENDMWFIFLDEPYCVKLFILSPATDRFPFSCTGKSLMWISSHTRTDAQNWQGCILCTADWFELVLRWTRCLLRWLWPVVRDVYVECSGLEGRELGLNAWIIETFHWILKRCRLIIKVVFKSRSVYIIYNASVGIVSKEILHLSVFWTPQCRCLMHSSIIVM